MGLSKALTQNPFINFGLGLLNMVAQQKAVNAANQKNEQRYNQVLYGNPSGPQPRRQSAVIGRGTVRGSGKLANRARLIGGAPTPTGQRAESTEGEPDTGLDGGLVGLRRRTLANLNRNQRGETQAATQRQQQALGAYDAWMNSALAGGGQRMNRLLGDYRNDTSKLLSEYDTAMNPIVQGYADRYRRIMGQLEGMGKQERQDIRTQYDALRGTIQQNLIDRGLGGTTVVDSMRAGNERERRDALGRLDERLREQQANWDASLSADELAARSGVASGRLGLAQSRTTGYEGLDQSLSGQLLDARTNMGAGRNDFALGLSGELLNLQRSQNQERLGTDAATAKDIFNFMAAREDAAPAQSEYLQLLQGIGAAKGNADYLSWYKGQQKNTLGNWFSNMSSMLPLGLDAGISTFTGVPLTTTGLMGDMVLGNMMGSAFRS